jgi:hypothetical protein
MMRAQRRVTPIGGGVRRASHSGPRDVTSALPVLLAGVGLVAVRSRHRGLLVVMVALVVFCVLAVASVGLFYLPAAVALVIAVVGWRHALSPPPAASDPSAGEGKWDIQGSDRTRCHPSGLVRCR